MTASRIYDLADFDTVNIVTGVRALIKTGGPHAVRVEGPDDILDKLEVSVASGRLFIGIGHNFLDFVFGGGLLSLLGRGDIRLTAYVTLPILNGAEASSGARIAATNVESRRFDAEASSGARVEISGFAGGDVRALASSGGLVELGGAASEIDAEASSGGSVRAERLTAARARLDASSGGRVTARVTERLRAGASSGGAVEVEGNPAERETNSASGGSVRVH
jgi:hypothetical protein